MTLPSCPVRVQMSPLSATSSSVPVILRKKPRCHLPCSIGSDVFLGTAKLPKALLWLLLPIPILLQSRTSTSFRPPRMDRPLCDKAHVLQDQPLARQGRAHHDQVPGTQSDSHSPWTVPQPRLIGTATRVTRAGSASIGQVRVRLHGPKNTPWLGIFFPNPPRFRSFPTRSKSLRLLLLAYFPTTTTLSLSCSSLLVETRCCRNSAN